MKVQVCDFRNYNFNEHFLNSITNTGFAVITNHSIDYGLIKEAQSVWRRFFKLSDSVKNQFINKEDTNLGYSALGNEKAVGAIKVDIKEYFHWKPNNKLPTEPALITQRMFYQLEDIGSQLLYIVDSVRNTNYKAACDDSDNTILRTLYYPALRDVTLEEGSVRAAAHEDINFITLLVAASAPGLQVMDKNGSWHSVPHEDNSLIVNAGDMLQLASDNYFKSTTHRVINPDNSDTDRISMPIFIHPHSDTILAPGITAQQFLNERLNAIYKKGYK